MNKKRKFFLLPKTKLVTISTTKLVASTKNQFKMKRLRRVKKFQTYKVCWLYNPFFRFKKPFKVTRRNFFRMKHRNFNSLLRRLSLMQKRKVVSKSVKIRLARKQKRAKKAKQKRKNLFLKRRRKRKKVKRSVFARFIARKKNYTRQFKGKNSFIKHNLFNNKIMNFGTVNISILHSLRMQPSLFYEFVTYLRILLRGKKKKKRKQRRKYQHIWRYFVADIPVSKRPKHIRMGKGKGDVSFWIFRARKGTSLIEFNFFSKKKIKYILFRCKKKISFHLALSLNMPLKWKNLFCRF